MEPMDRPANTTTALPAPAAPRFLGLAFVAAVAAGTPAAMPYPSRTQPPFADLHSLDGIMTSNDEYGIWAHWPAASYRLEYPGRKPLEFIRPPPELQTSLAVSCRADGRDAGFSGPEPLWAELVLPLHPDEPDVPHFFDPRYWIIALFRGEAEETPVSVRIEGGQPFPSTLRRARIDWSFPRPAPTVRLDPTTALAALASATASVRLAAEGPGTRLEIHFAPAPALAATARLIDSHCPR